MSHESMHWMEPVTLRYRAMGSNFLRHLGKSSVTWAITWGFSFGGLVLVGWVSGYHSWWSRSDLLVILLAAAFGFVVRLLLELAPRELRIDSVGITVHHTSWCHLKINRSGILRLQVLRMPNGVSALAIERKIGKHQVIGIANEVLIGVESYVKEWESLSRPAR